MRKKISIYIFAKHLIHTYMRGFKIYQHEVTLQEFARLKKCTKQYVYWLIRRQLLPVRYVFGDTKECPVVLSNFSLNKEYSIVNCKLHSVATRIAPPLYSDDDVRYVNPYGLSRKEFSLRTGFNAAMISSLLRTYPNGQVFRKSYKGQDFYVLWDYIDGLSPYIFFELH